MWKFSLLIDTYSNYWKEVNAAINIKESLLDLTADMEANV
jgi:hypothetical protein